MECQLTEMIRPYAVQISKDCNAGNKEAEQVISLHRMVVSCPSDPAARALCEVAFKEWKKQYPTPAEKKGV